MNADFKQEQGSSPADGVQSLPTDYDGTVFELGRLTVIRDHVIEGLKRLAAGSVQCVVTSPPYWGLRAYLPKEHPLKPFEIGQEKTPADYINTMLAVFGGANNPVGIWRALREDGTVWLNLGDCYSGSGRGVGDVKTNNKNNGSSRDLHDNSVDGGALGRDWVKPPPGFKAKDLIGIPWRVALALQESGWYLRSDIIWAKPNCMPESVTDRPTRSHEYLFLLTKSPRYFYDHDAIKEPCIYDVDGTGTAARKARAKEGQKGFPPSERAGIRPAVENGAARQHSPTSNGGYKNSVNFEGKNKGCEKQRGHGRRHDGFNDRWDDMEKEEQCTGMRNKRDVWTVSPANYPEAHFATFPPELIMPCILAGTSARGCCPECGAPYQRKTELGESDWEHQLACGGDVNGEYHGQSTKDHAAHGVQDASAVKARILNGMRERRTVDWEATCKCAGNLTGENGEHGDGICRGNVDACQVVPCLVLDPFGGSGTTGEVALELGRRAVLIELNPNYVPLITKRTNAVTPGLPM